jgi:hypothetical protein
VGEVFDHTHHFKLEIGADPIPKFVQAAMPKQQKSTRQRIVNKARQAETDSLTNLVSSCTPSGSQVAETGGPGLVGRHLVEESIPSTFADTAHYTLTTQRDYTSRGAASGLSEPAPAIGVGTEEHEGLLVSKGYKILMKKLAPDDQASELLRIEEQPPLVSIAFAWTKTATNKINRERRLSKQAQGGSASSSSAAMAPVVFVASTEPAPTPAEVSSAVSSDSEDEHVPFAWMKGPVTGTGSTAANPTELTTPFDGDVWNLLEGKLDILNAETAAKTRDTIQKASEEASKASEAATGASSSSAAAGSSSPQQPPEPTDTTPWETDAKFQHNLKYLAWMLKKTGGPPPVFVDPGTDNPMDVDYTIDE